MIRSSALGLPLKTAGDEAPALRLGAPLRLRESRFVSWKMTNKAPARQPIARRRDEAPLHPRYHPSSRAAPGEAVARRNSPTCQPAWGNKNLASNRGEVDCSPRYHPARARSPTSQWARRVHSRRSSARHPGAGYCGRSAGSSARLRGEFWVLAAPVSHQPPALWAAVEPILLPVNAFDCELV